MGGGGAVAAMDRIYPFFIEGGDEDRGGSTYAPLMHGFPLIEEDLSTELTRVTIILDI